MAFVENITYNLKNINKVLLLKHRDGVQYINAHKVAATTIQRHYRGYYTRLYFSKLNLAAVIIQKHWKGYIAKRYFNNLAIKTFVNKSIDFYNNAAIIIQKNYKGYYTRKYCLDLKKMRRWLKEIQKKNDNWWIVLQDYHHQKCKEIEMMHKEKVKCMIVEMINKNHPMLRTISKKGVYSTKENIYEDSEFEKFIRDTYEYMNKIKS